MSKMTMAQLRERIEGELRAFGIDDPHSDDGRAVLGAGYELIYPERAVPPPEGAAWTAWLCSVQAAVRDEETVAVLSLRAVDGELRVFELPEAAAWDVFSGLSRYLELVGRPR